MIAVTAIGTCFFKLENRTILDEFFSKNKPFKFKFGATEAVVDSHNLMLKECLGIR